MAISQIKRMEKALFGLRMYGFDEYISANEVPDWDRMYEETDLHGFIDGMRCIYDGSGAGLDLDQLLHMSDDDRMAVLTVLQLLIAPTWE